MCFGISVKTLVPDPITKMLQMDGNEKLLINEKKDNQGTLVPEPVTKIIQIKILKVV